MAIIDQINNLRLDYLEHGWVKAIYQSEFLEFCDLPPAYESAIETLDLNSAFMDIIQSTELWLNSEDTTSEEKSWASLSHSIQQKKVLAILAYYINYGCKNVHTKEYRNHALLASRVYYKLLTIPGYKAYHIYHSQLFAQSLACLSFPLDMCDDASNFNSNELTKEVNGVLKQLSEFVKDLTVVVQHLQLNPSDMNFEEILSNLVDITGYAIVDKMHVDKFLLERISQLIYKIIHTLLCDATGVSNETAVKLLFKCILPKLVNSCLDGRHANKCIGPSYVTYSILLLATHGKAALNGYMCLLEQLCICAEGLERAEVRDARSKLVVGMMSSLPPTSYTEFLKWLTTFSRAPRLPHRQIILETLAKLLENELEEEVEKNETIDYAAPISGSNEQEPQPSNDQMASQQHNVAAVPVFDVFDEDKGSLLRERKHKAIHADILHALYDRTDDESGTVRTRALAILTKCVTSKHVPLINAIKHLNGDGEVSRLMAVTARCANDERAVVRKAAATLLLQLLADPSAPQPQDEQLAFLVSLCRDASIIVRTSAIAALGDLLTVRPSETVLNAFLDGPLHQISDPETKVQEQVLSLIERLLIDRLRKFTTPGSDDPTPWMFLEGIDRRFKVKHLEKACLMLSKSSKCINHRLVDILSSHLGALSDERDFYCLLLLTSVALHVDYSEVGFVLEYYYKLTDNEQFRNPRLLRLTIDLLSAWCRFIRADDRTQLRDHLVQRLAAARQNAYRIKCSQLAAQLDPDNLTWATEIMQMSERRAVGAGELHEALRAADLSLTAPVPPGPALLRLFLAVADAPPEWDADRCAYAVTGAARLCIRSRDAAVASAPVFAELLARVGEPLAVRVNSLVGLSDICVRYTCIVEPLLGSICDCLSKDAPVMLRRMATRELTRLLLGEYLRLRTPLYYRYCALLADEDVGVRGPAEYYIACGLTNDAIYHHFVECVLHYNHDDKNHIKFDDRQLIYDVMLQRMSLVQKLNIQCRLAHEVLEHAADLTDEGDEELPPAMNAALLDTITLLCGPRMKLPKKPQKAGEMHDIDDLQERVTSNIVSHKMKIQVAEVLVPAVLRLYTRLSPRGGQINTYLVQLAIDLLKDYEQEIKEIFEDNEELMKNIQRFQSTIGVQATFGNVRNLVTATAPAEPDTPRAARRPTRAYTASPRKRALRI